MYNSKPEPMTRVGLRLPVWLRDKVTAEAEKQRRSISDVVRVILEDYFARKTKSGKPLFVGVNLLNIVQQTYALTPCTLQPSHNP